MFSAPAFVYFISLWFERYLFFMNFGMKVMRLEAKAMPYF